MAKKKWYGVAAGKKPGVYDTWFGENGAKVQIDGYKGAVYKGFMSYEEAKLFVEGKADFSPVEKAKPAVIPENSIIVYTDGGCINNPGSGGYGAVILLDDGDVELSGGVRYTTNNRMEMLACIKAMEYLKDRSEKIIIHTDSAYISNAVNKGWLKSWERNGWLKSNKEPVLNSDLWKEILSYLKSLNVEIRWVKGHAGVKYNERCDVLANTCARRENLDIDYIFEEDNKR